MNITTLLLVPLITVVIFILLVTAITWISISVYHRALRRGIPHYDESTRTLFIKDGDTDYEFTGDAVSWRSVPDLLPCTSSTNTLLQDIQANATRLNTRNNILGRQQ